MLMALGLIYTKLMNLKEAKIKYKTQGYLCKGRLDRLGNPIEMKLSFEQWLDIWVKSGKWDYRGRKSGQYVMSRMDDIGHYELGNVEIKLHSENLSEIKHNQDPRSKQVKTPNGIFPSLSAASKHYNKDRQTIANWCKSKPEFHYI